MPRKQKPQPEKTMSKEEAELRADVSARGAGKNKAGKEVKAEPAEDPVVSVEEVEDRMAALLQMVDGVEDEGVGVLREKLVRVRELLAEGSYADEKERKTLEGMVKGLVLAFTERFHEWFREVYPWVLFERGEDKTFFIYVDEETEGAEGAGIYEEVAYPVVRGLVVRELLAEGLPSSDVVARNVLVRYRACYPERGVAYADFDEDEDWFHARNGWVNVRTLAFEGHTPERRSRWKSDVAYNAEATCELYDTFVGEHLGVKVDAVRVIDQYSGLLLTRSVRHQKMLAIIGQPGTGKSTLGELWAWMLGDLAVKKQFSDFTDEKLKFAGSSLVGRTFCLIDEVKTVTRRDMGTSLNTLITGTTLSVERKGIDGIARVPNHLKFMLVANNLPSSAEDGSYRRLMPIMLEVGSLESRGLLDRDMPEKLRGEASGVLNRMLRGLADLRKMGDFTMIEGAAEVMEQYKADSNSISEYLDTFFEPVLVLKGEEVDTPHKIRADYLYTGYLDFMRRVDYTYTPRRFGKQLDLQPLEIFRGIRSWRKSGRERYWVGLQLIDGYEWDFEHVRGPVIREVDDVGGEARIRGDDF